MSADSSMTRHLMLAARVLLLLAAVRLFWVWASDPMLAVANNYDMIRVQACIDAYPDRPASVPPEANSYEAPLSRYRFVADVGAPCFPTSEAIFAALAWPGMWIEHKLSGGSFSLRWVGGAKLLLLLAAIVALHRALRRSPDGAVLAAGHATLVFAVLADPGISLYLNGFYAEYAAAFFAYLLFGALAVALARARDRAPRRRWLAAIALFAILLALAKVQHVVTPLLMFFALLALRLLRTRIDRQVLIALALGAVVGGLLQGLHLASERTASMRRANIVNTVFYAMLPRSTDPLDLTRALGLDPGCSEHSGSSWFTPGMQEGLLCPGALQLTRLDLARALLHQPLLGPRVLLEGARRSRPWIPAYLGVVEGVSMGRLPTRHPSLDRPLSWLPMPLYLAAIGLLPLIALGLVRARRDPGQAAANAVLWLCAVLPPVSLAIVVFGDGYADTAKQSHFGTSVLLAGWLLAAMLVARWIRARRHAPDATRERESQGRSVA